MQALESPRLLGDSWELFSESLSMLRENTNANYLKSFIAFLDYHNLTSEEFYEAHRENLKSDRATIRKRTSRLVYEYQKSLVENGMKVGSSKIVIKSVSKFFQANELFFKMNGLKVKIENESQVTREIAGLSKSELQKIINLCGSVRMLTMIHVAKESGMRIGDVCALKKETLKPILENPNLQWFTWTMLPEKNRVKEDYPILADPVLGPESIKWIHTWIQELKKKGVESEYLFCNLKNTPRIIQRNGKIREASHKGDKLLNSNISAAFRKLIAKAGLAGKNISFHSLRKYMQTQLEGVGVPTNWIYRIQGRSQGSGTRYTKPSESELIEKFSEGYHALRTDIYSHDLLSSQQRRIRALENERDELLKVQRNFNAIQDEMILLKAFIGQHGELPNMDNFEAFKEIEALSNTDISCEQLEKEMSSRLKFTENESTIKNREKRKAYQNTDEYKELRSQIIKLSKEDGRCPPDCNKCDHLILENPSK